LGVGCKADNLAKSKAVETGSNLVESFKEEGSDCFASDDENNI
jgi:hypothetical protein